MMLTYFRFFSRNVDNLFHLYILCKQMETKKPVNEQRQLSLSYTNVVKVNYKSSFQGFRVVEEDNMQVHA